MLTRNESIYLISWIRMKCHSRAEPIITSSVLWTSPDPKGAKRGDKEELIWKPKLPEIDENNTNHHIEQQISGNGYGSELFRDTWREEQLGGERGGEFSMGHCDPSSQRCSLTDRWQGVSWKAVDGTEPRLHGWIQDDQSQGPRKTELPVGAWVVNCQGMLEWFWVVRPEKIYFFSGALAELFSIFIFASEHVWHFSIWSMQASQNHSSQTAAQSIFKTQANELVTLV